MQNVNLQLFNYFNAPPGLTSWHLHLAIFFAKYLIFIVPLWLAVRWLWGPTKYRTTLLVAVLAAILGLILSYVIGKVWYVPRPFVAHIGQVYLQHRPDGSFPSDHMTFMWAIAFAFLLRKGMRLPGFIIAVFSLAVGWSRVYLGIHYPFDIIGAMVIAMVSVGIIKMFQPTIEYRLLPLCELTYRKLFATAIAKQWVKN